MLSIHSSTAFSVDFKKRRHCKWKNGNRSLQHRGILFIVDGLVFLAGTTMPLYILDVLNLFMPLEIVKP